MSAVLFDTNVWIALAFSTHPYHGKAKDTFEIADSQNPVVFCRATQQSFLRLVTTKAIQQCYGSEAISNQLAIDRWNYLASMPQVISLGEPPDLAARWFVLAGFPRPAPKLWVDGYLAAFAINYGIPLVTLDADFLQFEGLQTRLLRAIRETGH